MTTIIDDHDTAIKLKCGDCSNEYDHTGPPPKEGQKPRCTPCIVRAAKILMRSFRLTPTGKRWMTHQNTKSRGTRCPSIKRRPGFKRRVAA